MHASRVKLPGQSLGGGRRLASSRSEAWQSGRAPLALLRSNRIARPGSIRTSALMHGEASVKAATVAMPELMDAAEDLECTWDNAGDLQPTGEWRRNLDLRAWGEEIRALEVEIKARQTVEDDISHLQTIRMWANASLVTGLALCPFTPLSSIFISTAIMARWTMIGHHVCHGGYNSLQSDDGKVTGLFHRRTFALGPQRRILDWLDWMLPEAWDVEHNNLHHYKLGESGDPDLVERNLEDIIRWQKPKGVPAWLRTAQLLPLICIWKWYYYSPNTLKEMEKWDAVRAQRRGEEHSNNFTELGEKPATAATAVLQLLSGKPGQAWELAKCIAPYGAVMFGLIPGTVWALLGPEAGQTALLSVVLAEVLTNIHSFCIIVTNHAGDDVYKFDTPVKVKSDEFYLRAVIGSVNFHTGSDYGKPGSAVANAVDFPQGWLNYQIEHHMWPDMSMLSYQRAAPRVKAICEKYGVPYVQQPVWQRVKKTVDIMTGESNMLNWDKGQ